MGRAGVHVAQSDFQRAGFQVVLPEACAGPFDEIQEHGLDPFAAPLLGFEGAVAPNGMRRARHQFTHGVQVVGDLYGVVVSAVGAIVQGQTDGAEAGEEHFA